METDKKVKRPRIGTQPASAETGSYEKVNYPYDTQAPAQAQASQEYQPRQNYSRNSYGNDRQGYAPNRQYNNYYNRQQNYQRRDYQTQDNAAGDEQGQPREYQPRQNYSRQYQQGNSYNQGYGRQNYNRQGGYGNNRQGGYNNRQGGYNQNNNYRRPNNNPNRFIPVPRPAEYILQDVDPNQELRLNKYLSNSGLCSRREADEKIVQGLVKVNGEVASELGIKIKPSDIVEVDGKVVTPERKAYVLLNKPKDCVTTSDDPRGRTTVMDIVKRACRERIYPVGRLDRNTTGVLLLTNDGDLASKLTHPKFVKKKIYHVWLDKSISDEDMQRIADGIELEDGEIHADEISFVNETDRNQVGISIHSGRNRIVRRIFEALGYRVVKLDRVYFAGLTKKNLPRGKWRHLTQEEVNYLRMGSFE